MKVGTVVLDPSVDVIIANDILGLDPSGGDFSAYWNGKHRVNRVLKKLGQTYYLGLRSYRHQVFHAAKISTWAQDDSILVYNNKFDTLIAKCY